MKTLTKLDQLKISPLNAVKILQNGNKRFVDNLRFNRNLLQQINETSDDQHPFAVIISCMDSRSSAELIFDQGLGDIFSIRVAGNVVNEDILGSAEYGCKIVGAKIIVVLGHTKCGAINGAIAHVELGHLQSITSKIQRCSSLKKHNHSLEKDAHATLVAHENVVLGVNDIRTRSEILREMENNDEIIILGGIYDVSTGVIKFFEVLNGICNKNFASKEYSDFAFGESV
jgi:carbonic anhydrase